MPLIIPTITATIGDAFELGSEWFWVRCSFAMPNITNPKTNDTVTGGQPITEDLLINLSGTTLLNRQSVAQQFTEAYATELINKEFRSIINT